VDVVGEAAMPTPKRTVREEEEASATSTGPLWTLPADALPVPPPNQRRPISHVGRSALFACSMLDIIRDQSAYTGIHVKMRIGFHTGKAVGGIIGRTRPRYFVWGSDADVAEMMEQSGQPMEVHVSQPAALRLAAEGFVLVPTDTVALGRAGDANDALDDKEGASSFTEMAAYVLVGLDRVRFRGGEHSVDPRARAVAPAGAQPRLFLGSGRSQMATPRLIPSGSGAHTP
jgi:hypothetical protein